jgi:hypothetical protein
LVATAPAGRHLSLALDRFQGSVVVNEGGEVSRFTPLADGRPFLRGCQLLASERRQEMLALLVRGSEGVVLHILRLPDGVPLGRLALSFASEQAFMLSPDGSHIARLTAGRGRVVVEAVADLGRPRAATPKGKPYSPDQLRVELGTTG